jgi:branched-subunit amino acid transport protein AzlD
MMSNWQNLIFFLIMSLTTILTRALPFLLFPDQARTPAFVRYLGHVLPYPVIGMLVVYCFKDLNLRSAPYGLPELIAIIAIILVHLWRKNALISIGSGTVIYMLLIQLAF